jgi:hypothetical protein
MRILITAATSPESIASANLGEMAEWLVDQGYLVRVIAAPHIIPWKVDPAHLRPRYRRNNCTKVEVARPLAGAAFPGGLAR